MTEELGRITKPSVEDYNAKRKLLLVPLIFPPPEAPLEFVALFSKYWEQIESQVSNLESKLGSVTKIYHELIPAGAEDGAKAIEELNEASHRIVKTRLEKEAALEPVEDSDLLTEFMDWSRCLIIGLQNPRVIARVHESYVEAHKKRNEAIASKLDETLGTGDIGLIFIREGHQIQFPSDIEVFYVAPPALDELKRWARSQEAKPQPEES